MPAVEIDPPPMPEEDNQPVAPNGDLPPMAQAVAEEGIVCGLIVTVLFLATTITWIVVMATNSEWPGSDLGVRMRRWGPQICATVDLNGAFERNEYSCASLSRVQDMIQHNRSIHTVFSFPEEYRRNELEEHVRRVSYEEKDTVKELAWICPDRSWGEEWEHLARLEFAALMLGPLAVVGYGVLLAVYMKNASPRHETVLRGARVFCVVAVVFCSIVLVVVSAVSAARSDRASACSTGEIPSARSVLGRGGNPAGPITLAVLTLVSVATMAASATNVAEGETKGPCLGIFAWSNSAIANYSIAVFAASTLVEIAASVFLALASSDDGYPAFLSLMTSTFTFIFSGSLASAMCYSKRAEKSQCCAKALSILVVSAECFAGLMIIIVMAMFARWRFVGLLALPAMIVVLSLPAQTRLASLLR